MSTYIDLLRQYAAAGAKPSSITGFWTLRRVGWPVELLMGSNGSVVKFTLCRGCDMVDLTSARAERAISIIQFGNAAELMMLELEAGLEPDDLELTLPADAGTTHSAPAGAQDWDEL